MQALFVSRAKSCLLLALISFVIPIHAQQANHSSITQRSLITAAVDESRLKILKGNTHPLARAEFDLGTLDLKASALAKLKGKPAPDWNITAARGVKSSAKLSDYKGKWVYLEFWGFW